MASLGGLDMGFGTDIHFTEIIGNRLLATLFTLITLAIFTRFLSGVFGASKTTQHGKTIPLAPYWLPVVGHMPQFFFFRGPFFTWARQTYRDGAFAINLGGTVHNIIFKPDLGQMLMNQKNAVADSASVSRYMMCAIFGYSKKELDLYDRALPDVLECYKAMTSQPGLNRLVESAVTGLKTTINDFITFSSSPVDQMPWERPTSPRVETVRSGDQFAVVDLFRLTRDYVGRNVNAALFGTDFVANNPGIFDDLWQFDNGFTLLAASLPGWLPIPALMRAAIARRRMLAKILEFEHALDKWGDGGDPGSGWNDLDDISDLLRQRLAVYKKYGMSFDGRAACELALLWAANANSNSLIAWMLYRVYSDKDLLADVRAEVAACMRVRFPDQELPVAEMPVLDDVDHDALAEKCPFLKAAYIESLRADTSNWSFKIMREDCVLTSRDKDTPTLHVRKGTYCHVAHELHHKNPQQYQDPEAWRPQRHLKTQPGEVGSADVVKADIGTVRAYGGGHSMCKGRQFAMKEILIFGAAIFLFWDIEPLNGRWEPPTATRTVGTNGMKGQYKVKVRRRKIVDMQAIRS